jgi:hypothetical protein
MDDEKKRLLEQAARCHRLAASIADAEAAAKLKALAQEYEAKAERQQGHSLSTGPFCSGLIPSSSTSETELTRYYAFAPPH